MSIRPYSATVEWANAHTSMIKGEPVADRPPRPDTGDDADRGLPRWVQLAGIVAAVVILLVVVIMISGGPGAHIAPVSH